MSSELSQAILKEADIREESLKVAVRHQAAYCRRDLSDWASELDKLGHFSIMKKHTADLPFGLISHFGLLDIYPDREAREAFCLNKVGQIWIYRCYKTGPDRRVLVPGEVEVDDQGYITHTPTALRRMAQLLEAQS